MTQLSHSLGIYLEVTKIEKGTYIPLFIAALFTIAKTWKQPRCPSTDEWIKKLWYIYTMEYYSAIKRNTFESILMRWMNLELADVQTGFIKAEESCLTLCDPIDGSPPGSSVPGILQARILECVAISFSKSRGIRDQIRHN